MMKLSVHSHTVQCYIFDDDECTWEYDDFFLNRIESKVHLQYAHSLTTFLSNIMEGLILS